MAATFIYSKIDSHLTRAAVPKRERERKKTEMAQHIVHIYMYIQSRHKCHALQANNSNTAQYGKLPFCSTHKYVTHTICISVSLIDKLETQNHILIVLDFKMIFIGK